MQPENITELASVFLALSDKTRLRLLSLMAEGEVSVGYLADAIGASQPKISRHLAFLRSAGLVSARRDGKWIYYGIQRPADPTAAAVIDAALNLAPATPQLTPSIDDIFDETDMSPFEVNDLEIYLL